MHNVLNQPDPLSIGQVDKEERTFKEVKYTCSNVKCQHTQVIRFFADQPILPAVNCVECKNGFDFGTVREMLNAHHGMFPGEVHVVAA